MDQPKAVSVNLTVRLDPLQGAPKREHNPLSQPELPQIPPQVARQLGQDSPHRREFRLALARFACRLVDLVNNCGCSRPGEPDPSRQPDILVIEVNVRPDLGLLGDNRRFALCHAITASSRSG
jgi:hypothetical protein